MAEETIYLCNFRVSVDGEWLCLRELGDLSVTPQLESPQEVPEENDPPKDPTAIERANLLNMVKLSIKSLIESSYQVGRTLDKDFAPLQQFLIVMEHVLKHGLKAKKSILSTNKHVWGPLEAVEKLEPEATEINNSVRELPQIKTYPGKARAWLRLAMMQKRLADYVKTLVEKKDVMGEFYEPFALLMEEEGMVLAGLLVGLNVIDCNFCVKEDDFDSQLGVIDFSMYLKDPGNYTDRSPGEASRTSTNSSQANLTAVLDQKNYVEELNRHLNATVTNLQARIENLEKDNSNLSEKLAMANNRVLQLQEEGDKLQSENTRIKGDLEKKLVAVQQDVQTERETYQKSRAGLDDMYVEAQKQLRDETQMRLQKKVSFAAPMGSENPGDVERADTSAKLDDKDVEKELELQISMKQEMEMAMKLLEKDIHEKQDMIVGLRKQLDDIKAINIDMYKKFQAAEGSLKHKTEMLIKLEEKCTQMSQTIKDIEQRLKQAEREKMGAEEAARKLGKQLVDKDTKRAAVETDLKIEREWRTALQQDIEKQKEVIQELQTELQQMEAVKKEFQSLQAAHEQLKQTCEDQEKTLAEMGHKLSESKLKMEDMKEALKDELKFNQDKVWTDDKDVTECRQCDKLFSVSRRKVGWENAMAAVGPESNRSGAPFLGGLGPTHADMRDHNSPMDPNDSPTESIEPEETIERPPDWVEERFRVDRRKLEAMLQAAAEGRGQTGEEFFQKPLWFSVTENKEVNLLAENRTKSWNNKSLACLSLFMVHQAQTIQS
ncbi:RUFY2 [Branchiostoma lanceolatum]|uniref:RUFY2 protein n=1 Tax=Branchiostoma lanceolatum TaxID=7740 RepID=A0A8K0ECE4_BRALA|nr:RUFY2 [Branchiostoma lanceolatum]